MFFKKFPALASSDFRIWWAGQLVSSIGNQMQIVAVNWQIYTLTHSALALGLLGLIRFVPIIFCSLLGGMIADNYNRKITNLIMQFVMLAIAGAFFSLTLTHTVVPAWIYALTLVHTIAYSFELPTRHAFIPNIVKTEQLSSAMSLNTILRETATIAGPSLAGFLIAIFDVGPVYLMNVLSFLVIIVSLAFIKASGRVEKSSQSAVSWRSMREGLNFVRSKTMIWSTMILDFFATFFSGAMTLMPIFAVDVLKVGPQGLGILYSAPSVGAVITGLYIAHRHTISKQGKVLLIAVVFYGLGTIIFGLSKSFWLSCLALFIVGAGDSISAIIRNVVRQTITPDKLRGRMVAISMIFFIGGPQLGEFEAGIVASLIGAPLGVALGGVGTIAVVAIMAYLLPQLRNYSEKNRSF